MHDFHESSVEAGPPVSFTASVGGSSPVGHRNDFDVDFRADNDDDYQVVLNGIGPNGEFNGFVAPNDNNEYTPVSPGKFLQPAFGVVAFVRYVAAVPEPRHRQLGRTREYFVGFERKVFCVE